MKKRGVCLFLILCLLLPGLPARASGGVITGFAPWEPVLMTVSPEARPEEAALTAQMPASIGVYLDGGEDVFQLPVRWVCPGGYDEDAFYFQFSPVWDEETYPLASWIDRATKGPYVGVIFRGVELMTVTSSPYEQDVFDYLVDELGVNTAAACGIMANIQSESGFYPNNLQNSYEKSLGYTDATYTRAVDNGSYTNFVYDKAGYGLCQWTFWSRKQGLLNLAQTRGVSIADLEMQMDYFVYELKQYSSLMSTLRSVPNTAAGAYTAAYQFCWQFERPGGYETKSPQRGNLAQNTYWPEYAGTVKPSSKPTYATLRVSDDTVTAGKMITFTCSSDGDENTLKITKPNGRTSTYPDVDSTVRMSFDDEGGYSAVLVASNDAGSVTSRRVYFDVVADVSGPTYASIRCDKSTGYAIGETITFTCQSDGTRHVVTVTDPDGKATNYNDVGSTLRVSYAAPGHYTATLTAYKGSASTTSSKLGFNVLSGAPTKAEIKADKDVYDAGETVTLTCVSDGTYNEVLITRPSGKVSTYKSVGMSLKLYYDEAGTYTAQLRTTNDQGEKLSEKVTFTIKAAPVAVVSVSVENGAVTAALTSVKSGYSLLCAMYEKSGRMAAAVMTSLSDGQRSCSVPLGDGEIETVKVVLLDDGGRPLCQAVSRSVR